jgi:hypothetical protein
MFLLNINPLDVELLSLWRGLKQDKLLCVRETISELELCNLVDLIIYLYRKHRQSSYVEKGQCRLQAETKKPSRISRFSKLMQYWLSVCSLPVGFYSPGPLGWQDQQ